MGTANDVNLATPRSDETPKGYTSPTSSSVYLAPKAHGSSVKATMTPTSSSAQPAPKAYRSSADAGPAPRAIMSSVNSSARPARKALSKPSARTMSPANSSPQPAPKAPGNSSALPVLTPARQERKLAVLPITPSPRSSDDDGLEEDHTPGITVAPAGPKTLAFTEKLAAQNAPPVAVMTLSSTGNYASIYYTLLIFSNRLDPSFKPRVDRGFGPSGRK